jgi:polyisoprenoid-binding protein YceI
MNRSTNMHQNVFKRFSARHTQTGFIYKRTRGVIAMAAAFAIGGVFLVANGCDGSTDGVAATPGAITPVVPDRHVSPADATALAAKTSIVQYVSAPDPGQALVSGTSTLHDWTIKSGSIKGNTKFSGELKAEAGSAVAIESIELSIQVESLKSTEGSGMDNTMYEALNSKKFPTITYKLSKASIKNSPAKDGAPFHFDTTGQLTVSGNARPVSLDLAVTPTDDGKLNIATDIGLKMTDFGVKPPTAMLGMIKSGDAIKLKVSWQLTRQP